MSHPLPLQERLDALKAQLASRNALEARATVRTATDALVASNQEERAVKAGERSPALTLSDMNGVLVRSHALLARGRDRAPCGSQPRLNRPSRAGSPCFGAERDRLNLAVLTV